MESNETKIYLKNVELTTYLGRQWFVADVSAYSLPYPIIPTKGEHNLTTCKECALIHKKIKDEVKVRFEKFPNCCEYHTGLLNQADFKKSDFKDIDLQVADKIMFSYHHIINTIENEDWYSDIIDYLEYVIISFGEMPENCGEPFELGRLKDNVKALLLQFSQDYISPRIDPIDARLRINKIIEIIDQPRINQPIDEFHFHKLLNTYQDWFNFFPFDLSYLQNLKAKFDVIPILNNGKRHYNKYSGVWIEEIHTRQSLIVELINITNKILVEINTVNLHLKGELNDIDTVNLELIIKERKLELEEMTLNPNETKADFIKILKKWIKGERRFVGNIIRASKPKREKTKITHPTNKEIALYAYYMSEVNDKSITDATFPSEKAYEELGKEFSRHPKNIQLNYNKFRKDKNERLNPKQYSSIQYVIENMLTRNEKALLLANDELKMVQIKR